MNHRILSTVMWILMAGVSATCIVTAVRIEYLNHLAGDAIQRKAENEPHSKWRMGDGFFAAYRAAEAEWRKNKGLSRDVELSHADRDLIRERLAVTGWSRTPHERLGRVLETWGVL